MLFLFGKIERHGDAITRNANLGVAAKVEIIPSGKVVEVALNGSRELRHVVLGDTQTAAILGKINRSGRMRGRVALAQQACAHAALGSGRNVGKTRVGTGRMR